MSLPRDKKSKNTPSSRQPAGRQPAGQQTIGQQAADSARNSTLDRGLLDLLVCPISRAPLEYDKKAQELISKQAGLAFPIIDGVPVLLVGEARKIDSPDD